MPSMQKPQHIVALSGGKDSTAMALALQEFEPLSNAPGRGYRYVITPTGNELPEMFAHWALLEELLGAPLEVLGQRTLEDLMEAQECLPSTRMRWCTRMLKIEPVERFYRALPPGSIAYVGLRADEPEREGIFGSAVKQRFPLKEWGWTLQDVKAYLKARGVKIPPRTDCAWCPYQSADDWYRLWRNHPDLFARAEAWEETIGRTFRSPTAKHGRWAVSLKDMRLQFESGMVTREEKARQKRLGQVEAEDDDEEACRVCRL